MDTVSRTFVDKYQAEVVARRILLVHVAECWGKVESSKEQTDGDGFT